MLDQRRPADHGGASVRGTIECRIAWLRGCVTLQAAMLAKCLGSPHSYQQLRSSTELVKRNFAERVAVYHKSDRPIRYWAYNWGYVPERPKYGQKI
jgi:hypothetical protein